MRCRRIPAEATPTTVIGRPFTTIVRLRIVGSPANRRIQNWWLRTATGCPPGVRSSSGVNSVRARANAENVEVVAGDQLSVHSFGQTVVEHRQRRRESGPRRRRRRCFDSAEVAVNRIREGAVVEGAAAKRAGAVEHHEAPGSFTGSIQHTDRGPRRSRCWRRCRGPASAPRRS